MRAFAVAVLSALGVGRRSGGGSIIEALRKFGSATRPAQSRRGRSLQIILNHAARHAER
ncbi:hypothetical protein [Martelella mediterranea]|uniref:hypothetical protein n=1 Tax=Martelella mediterranea TaxID=293089 RepID=UPI001A9F0080|nr:hypothetical protein [Martelella mediterranea]